jgi:hypothetical protein
MTSLAHTHGEAAITCAKCGARQVLRGSKWEIAVAAELWRKQHERAEHDLPAPPLSEPCPPGSLSRRTP